MRRRLPTPTDEPLHPAIGKPHFMASTEPLTQSSATGPSNAQKPVSVVVPGIDPYKEGVGGSNPSTPTPNRQVRAYL
jgi:hypothetical protein